MSAANAFTKQTGRFLTGDPPIGFRIGIRAGGIVPNYRRIPR